MMHTPRFLISLLFLVLGLTGAQAKPQPPASIAAHGEGRPNVLFIAVDDLRPELGSYGTRALTPNLDRLARTGLRFERAYCNQAVCGASRTSLMTGLYPEFTGERTFHVDGWRERWPDVVTLNQHFGANHYTTVGLGKIYHGRRGPGVDPDNWTRWLTVSGKSYADPASMENARPKQSNAPGNRTVMRGPATESADVPDAVYTDGQTAAEGARQIKKLSAAGKPFFLAVGFAKPHLPFTAPARYWDLYEREAFTMPSNLAIPPGYPEWAANRDAGELRSYADIPPSSEGPASIIPMETNQRLIHGYHACVSYLDRNVGVLLDALEQSGAADTTIVVLWGDHGWKLGDHHSWCKHTNFECDTRVPLLIRHPQMPGARGSTLALTELIDLYPTLSELCGLAPPPHLQGKSLVPVLKNPAATHRDFAYSSYPHTAREPRRPVIGHSIRNQRYRYTEWWDKEDDTIVVRVLTDLVADPGETTNLLLENPELAKRFSPEVKRRVWEARKNASLKGGSPLAIKKN